MEDIKKEIKGWETAKKAAFCPLPQEARQILYLSVDQFCKLLDIDSATYWSWLNGDKKMSIQQRIFLKEAIRIAKEKGFI